MKGLELSECFYQEICAPMLRRKFRRLSGRIAAGLVGEGSECLGLDDELSRDHDWGVALCLWLGKRDYATYGKKLKDALDSLPASFMGYPRRRMSSQSGRRDGVWDIGQFYFKYIGCATPPSNLLGWMAIPDTNLATVTNGKIFADPVGEFTSIRKVLLAFYPEDVRRKKIAAQCANAAQSGQYNFPRCIKRMEPVAAAIAESKFIEAACSLVFLLNRHYQPFYKWSHKILKSLPILGTDIYTSLSELVSDRREKTSEIEKQYEIIENICAMIIPELVRQGLSDEKSDFLLDHGYAIQTKILDTTLKNMNIFIY
jgi:hypothetical protein